MKKRIVFFLNRDDSLTYLFVRSSYFCSLNRANNEEQL